MSKVTLNPQPAPLELTGDQREIWDFFEKTKIHCIKKNVDYGSSFLKIPQLTRGIKPSEAVAVRIGDKISRVQTLLTKADDPNIDESIEDTLTDAGVYFFLMVIARRREKK